MLDGLTAFLAVQIFGPYRRQLLAAILGELDENSQKDRKTEITATRRAIKQERRLEEAAARVCRDYPRTAVDSVAHRMRFRYP